MTSTLCAATFSNSYVKWLLHYMMLRFVAVPNICRETLLDKSARGVCNTTNSLNTRRGRIRREEYSKKRWISRKEKETKKRITRRKDQKTMKKV